MHFNMYLHVYFCISTEYPKAISISILLVIVLNFSTKNYTYIWQFKEDNCKFLLSFFINQNVVKTDLLFL